MDIEKVEQIKASICSGYYEGLIYPSGLVYRGGLYRKRPHGKGMIILPNGKYYQYEFDNGRLVNGRGIVVYPDGSFYEGEVSRCGNPFGRGIVRNPDGSTFFSGVWKHNYDPKIIWICGPPVEDSRGEVFQPPLNTNLYDNNQILHPAILLRNPEERGFSKYVYQYAYVMFPHLQEVGLPNHDNCFGTSRWASTPKEAILLARYNDVEHYIKSVISPDLIVMGRLHGLVKVTKWCTEKFGGESFGSKALEFLLEVSEKSLDIIQDDREKSLEEVINDFVKMIDNYYC